jgi:PAS domain S-box-containing protein
MKFSVKFMYLNSAIISIAILCSTFFSIVQMDLEATRQANAAQETRLKVFWEFLRQKGTDFRIENGKMMAGDYVINGNYELPDKIKDIYQGTATIFMGDVRVSTNVLKEDGSRAVGTSLTGPAYNAIFKMGKPFRGEAPILGIPYFTAYDPIIDRQGKIIGVLYVGVKKSEFFATYNRLAFKEVIVAGLLIAVFSFFTFILVRTLRSAEGALLESEKRLKSILHGSSIPQFVIDCDHKVLYWNRAMEKCTGKRSEEMVGSADHWKAFYPGSHPTLADLLVDRKTDELDAWYGGKWSRSRILDDAYEATDYFPGLADGGKWFHFTATLVHDSKGGVIGAVETLQDVTERKLAQDGLQEQFHFLQELIDDIPAPVLYRDVSGNYLGCNREFEEFMGLKKVDIIGKSVYDLHPKEMADVCLLSDRDLLDSPETTQITEATMQNASGDWKDILFYKTVYTTKDSGIGGIVGTFIDITERKLIENALRESEERFRKTFDQSPVGAAIVSLDYRFLRVNEQWCRITGYSEMELVGMSLNDISHPDDLERDLALKQELISGELDAFQMDKRYLNKDNRVIWARLSVCLLKSASGEPLYFLPMMEDITERKRLEQEVLKSQKLESLGVLAGGIAHDFNNLLTGILGNINLAKITIATQSRAYRNLIEAEKASLRARDLTFQLLTFSRGGAPIKKISNIGEIIVDSANFALRGSNVRCEFEIARDIRLVEVDEGQFSQVVNNLVLNACQAMPDGGLLKISVYNLAGEIPSNLPNDRDYIRVSIQDNGTGIPEEILPRIFDPYFTTKPKGSGLGLATVYSIVKNHGGLIQVESRVGQGSVFHIYLPASESSQVESIPQKTDIVQGQGRILLMDDEEIIRVTGGEMLSALGYSVTLCEEGSQMLDLYMKARESGGDFDAVILDLTIPGGIGGKEAMQRLLEIDPQAKGIVSSGYYNDPILASYLEYGFCGAVNKPYTVEEISEVLKAVLHP